MAKFNNIHNSTALDFGFSFDEFSTGIANVYAVVNGMLSTISNTSNFQPVENKDGSYSVYLPNDIQLWAAGSFGESSATIKELTLSQGDTKIFVKVNNGKISWENEQLSISPIKISEIYVGDSSNTGYGQAYMGNLTIDPDTLSLNGTVKTAYLIAGTTAAESGNAYCIRLTGSVTMTDGEFSGGSVTGIAWGSMMIGAGNEDPKFSWTSQVTGLKIDAVTLMNAVEAGGFDALPSFIFSGNDTLVGTTEADLLVAFAGNDKIDGGAGDDDIVGGAGNDTINGGAGDDLIFGDDVPLMMGIGAAAATPGNDKITDKEGDNTVYSGGGNDNITLGAGDDDVVTGDGNNTVNLGDGANRVEVGNGKNTITSGSGSDDIQAGSGNDTITAGNGDNHVDAGAGNNKITVGDGNDRIEAGAGNDTIKLGLGADTVDAGAGKNTIDLGKDTVSDTVEFDAAFFAAVTAKKLAENQVSNFLADDELWFDLESLNLTAADIAVGNAADISDAYIGLDLSTGRVYYDVDGAGTEFTAIKIAEIKGAGLKEGFTIETDGTVHF